MKTRVLAAIILSALALRPQNLPAQNQSEISSEETPVTFSSRVNLVSVPVVVRDREGRAVGNLTKEDFQLFDKGKLQVITKFSMDKSEPAPVTPAPASAQREGPERTAAPAPSQSALPDRYVAYLVDDIHLTHGDLLNARQALNRHLDEALDRSSRAAIFTTSGIMLSNFTDDRAKLHKAVNAIQPWTGGPDPHQDCPPVTYYVADVLTNQRLYFSGYLFTDQQILTMAGSDDLLGAVIAEAQQCSSLPLGPPPQAGTPPPQQPGAPPPPPSPGMIQIRATIRQTLSYGDRETDLAFGALNDVIRKIIAMPGTRSFVLVSPGFLVNTDHRLAEADVLERAIRAKVNVNTIDIRGLYTGDPGDADAIRYSSPMSGILRQADVSAASQADDVLEELADGTGGKFFHNDNDLKGGLDQLAARPEYLYVLGFSPQDLKPDGSFHALKVTVRNVPGAVLQVRHGYWAPRQARDAAEEARADISDAVFSRDEISEIPVDLQTEYFKPSDDKAEVTVVAHIRTDGLHFRKADERNNDQVTVVSGLFDSNGNFVKGIQRVITLHLRDQSLASLESTGIVVKEAFDVAPGRYVVRLVVRDAQGQTMAARNGGVEIP
jgi:VWFA-related protein